MQEAGNEANQKGWCNKAISDTEQKRTHATEEIKAPNAETAELEAVKETSGGLEALNEAIDSLQKFYATVNMSKVSFRQTPEKDAPGANFKNFRAYKGAQSGASGIVEILEAMQSDFERTQRQRRPRPTQSRVGP